MKAILMIFTLGAALAGVVAIYKHFESKCDEPNDENDNHFCI